MCCRVPVCVRMCRTNWSTEDPVVAVIAAEHRTLEYRNDFPCQVSSSSSLNFNIC